MARESIVLRDEVTRERFEFPVNPESITISHGRTFREVPIIDLESVLLAGNLVPSTLSWSGFFPARYDASFCNYPPERPSVSVRRLEKWLGRRSGRQRGPTPVRTVVTATYFSRLMVITEFETEFRGGEPGDVYYTISLQTWRRQQIRIKNPSSGSEAKDPKREKSGTESRSHTVRRGDTLWLISKKYYDQGSKWPTIYEANKSVIGSNPNLIKPGQVLVIP